MQTKQAQAQAAKDSKTGGARYVVWVFDQGREVYNREQVKRYSAFLQVESLFIDGVKIADAEIATRIAAL